MISLDYGFTTRQAGNMRDEQTMHAYLKHPVIYMRQDHTNKVHVITEIPQANVTRIDEVDALVYKKQGDTVISLVVKSADCVPIIFADEVHNIIAIAHSGWKGSFGNIVKETIEKMVELGAVKENLKAAIGPAIGSCCYNISPERAVVFEKAYPHISSVFIEHRENVIKLNLSRLVYEQLREQGIKKEHIEWKNQCTSCQSDTFYSFRREGSGMGLMMGYVSI